MDAAGRGRTGWVPSGHERRQKKGQAGYRSSGRRGISSRGHHDGQGRSRPCDVRRGLSTRRRWTRDPAGLEGSSVPAAEAVRQCVPTKSEVPGHEAPKERTRPDQWSRRSPLPVKCSTDKKDAGRQPSQQRGLLASPFRPQRAR